MLLVTGAAGFIGSNVVASLNEAGRTDIVVNDVLGGEGKWRNLASRQFADFIPPADLMRWLEGRKLEAVVHLGAISSTTATDGDLVIEANFRLPLRLFEWCASARTSFIYASSAATYGDGEAGYSDDWSGLKFFNVFGPNEYHKGEMMSLVAKRFDDAKAGSAIRLFKSHQAGIADGEQRRDFIYVDDAVAVVRWLLETPSVSGIFNVGSGMARSFRDLMTAMFAALGRKPAIEYIDMPASIRDSYQYFTQAETTNLRRAGYNADFTALEEAVQRYVTGYLDRPDRYR
jgi:ADP-L-glycero-D-manno-heptose 6-epimerase